MKEKKKIKPRLRASIRVKESIMEISQKRASMMGITFSQYAETALVLLNAQK